jgi:pimeloyl-ACP methyl ester carboxylesterase
MDGDASASPALSDDMGARDPAWVGIRRGWVRVNGHPVSFLRKEAEGEGERQLLVHGLGSSARSWLDVMVPLSDAGEVVAVDLPGFGETEIPHGGSARVRANAHFVRAFLDALGWDRSRLFGSSMGGLVTTLAAGWYPERINRLVLVNPALPTLRRESWRVPRRVFARIVPAATPVLGRAIVEAGLRAKSAEEVVEESLDAVFFDSDRIRPALIDIITEGVRETQERPWRRAAIAEAARSMVAMLIEGRTVEKAIASITAPTFVIWGDADLLVSGRVISGLVARRAEWHRHDLADIGHAPMLECPDDFVRLVLDWYRDAPPADAARTVARESVERLIP